MPDTATLPRFGLLTAHDRAPVPLRGVSVDADITSLCARVTVTQRFVNGEPQPIEAIYTFPLDEGAAVCGFELLVDGRVIAGEVRERESAFREYDSALERGDGAVLLDEERPDVFQASIGNLLPGKEAVVRITYVTELAVEFGSVRFVVPTTVSPRYAPAEDRVGLGRPDADALNPPVEFNVPYGFTLKARVSLAGGVQRIESPSHPVSIAFADGTAEVELSRLEPMDRDFVLAIDAASLRSPQAWLERDDRGGVAAGVALVPDLPQGTAPAEVIFLVDRSGSMGGSSIDEVRKALQICLRSMVAGCRFNIIGFGSSTELLFGASREYTERALEEAAAHVQAMQADLGGTDLLPALSRALEGPVTGLTRQVVVLTDGEITNTDAVLALARQHAGTTRIFTVGIGAGASLHLVKGLALAGGGASELVAPGERLESKVVRLMGRLLSPALTNIRVDWGGLDVTQVPAVVPPIFAGGRLMLYGLLRSGPDPGQAARVRLTADGHAGPVSFEALVDTSAIAQGRTVTTLSARARIRELETTPDFLVSRGSRQRDRKASAVSQEIVELATRYNLVSRETSFVAIERRESPQAGDMQLRRVPIALTHGWGGLELLEMADYRVDSYSRRLSAPMAVPPNLKATSLSRSFAAGLSRLKDALTEPRCLDASRVQDGSRGATTTFDRMVALITLQRADGGWDLTRDLAVLIGRDLHDLELTLPGVTDGEPEQAGRAWATMLATAWLEVHAPDLRPDWALVRDKADAWLSRLPAAAAWDEWRRRAEHVVR